MKMKFGTTFITEDDKCPVCKQVLDGAFGTRTRDGGPTEEGPQPGDISMCAHCVSLLIVGDDCKLRTPTVNEVLELQKHDHIWSMVERVTNTLNAFHAHGKEPDENLEID